MSSGNVGTLYRWSTKVPEMQSVDKLDSYFCENVKINKQQVLVFNFSLERDDILVHCVPGTECAVEATSPFSLISSLLDTLKIELCIALRVGNVNSSQDASSPIIMQILGPEAENIRNKTIKELITTEKTYINDMNVFIQVYMF